MKHLLCAALRRARQGAVAVILAASAAAHAGVITFDDLLPGSVWSSGEGFSLEGFDFTLAGNGFGLVDTVAAFGPPPAPQAPSGNDSLFLSAFNDPIVTMRSSQGHGFALSGLDFAFIPALPGAVPGGTVPGLLVAVYTTLAGLESATAWAFGPADESGAFAFQHLGADRLGALSAGVTEVNFYACMLNELRDCEAPRFNLGQFALDNIEFVPEPPVWALALLALTLSLSAAATAGRRMAAQKEVL